MTYTDVYEEMSTYGTGVASGPLGVTWGPIRVYCGGGIAGHSNEMWIDFPGHSEFEPIGPITNRRALRNAVRRILVAAIKMGEGVLAMGDLHPDDEAREMLGKAR